MIKNSNKVISIFMYSALLVSLYLMTRNFLLFHAYAEGFAIVIAALMFVLTWNSRNYIDNHYLHFIGLAYFFVAQIDFLHVLGYAGMNIFTGYKYYANQLWIFGRYMESLTLLFGFYFLYKQRKCKDYLVMFVYTVISAIGILSIFVWRNFPIAFIEGVGQTSFKLISEYIIIGILLLVLLGLKKYKEHFSTQLLQFISIAVVMTIFSELFFTFYVDNYGISNVMGHYFKIISFYLIYKSIVQKGIKEPYDIIFRNLDQKRQQLAEANETKTKLFSIIGHDLRTPFNGLLGVVDLLSEESDRLDEEEQKELFSALADSTHETYNLINNLLEWASANMESITVNVDNIKPLTIIHNVVNGQKMSLDKKSIHLNIYGNPEVTMVGDAASLETIIRNLLSNAIKFSYPRGTISIGVRDIGEEISIYIEDHGMGMTPEQIEKLMVSNINESTLGTANEKGMGLGFNIVKEFVHQNQGRLEIHSQKGKGSTIKLFFKKSHLN